jgi:hypothetical protein
MNSVPDPINNSISTYQLFAFFIIFLIFASIIYYTKDVIHYEWRKLYPVNELTGVSSGTSLGDSSPAKLDYKALAREETKNVLPAEGSNTFEQTWCLVGEDMAGRWCLQVKSPAACEANRTYSTKNKCETSSNPNL